MARGLNKVMIIGNLGQDPETRFLPSGDAVCNISVATDESYKNKEGAKVEKTEWHRVSMFGKLAEISGEYLRKGSKVYIEGKLETRKWQAQDGTDRYATDIKAFQMQMLDSKGSSSEGAPHQPAPAPATSQPPPTGQMPEPVDDFDDDIPF